MKKNETLKEKLKEIFYFDGDEYKFEDYEVILKELCSPTDKNIENMMKPYMIEGEDKYYGKPVYRNVSTTITPLKDESWKEHPFRENLEVSNYGRVKYKGKILNQFESDNKYDGYLKVKFGNKKEFVYKLAAETYCRVDELEKIRYNGFEIHHINNNGFQNIQENLIWLNENQHKIVHNKK